MTATPHLDRVLALAAGEHSGPDLGDEDRSDWDESDWDQVRQHLESQSPWFKKVMGGESPGEPDHEDVQLTPRTAEASTVPEPTVPPGGPGLFRIKGRQLPPYVQHLYKHLVGKYGKHRAYGVAIGIVKKWAKGINPGGKGKGHKVHGDVQAAAAKNVANWEESKAMAHHGRHGDHHEKDKAAASNVALARPYQRVEHGRVEHVTGYQRKLLAETPDGFRIYSRPDGHVDIHWHTPSGRMAYSSSAPRNNAAVSAELRRMRAELAEDRQGVEHLADLEGEEPEFSSVELSTVRAFERDVQGRMEKVNAYIRDNRTRIGMIGPESPMAHSELKSLYRASPEHEAAFRGALREARGHYAEGRHEEAKAALGKAEDIARQHNYSFTASALQKQREAIDAERMAAAERARRAAPAPAKKHGLFGRRHAQPVAATHLDTVVALAASQVRGYERRGKGGKLEEVRPHEENFRRALSELNPRRPWSKTAVFDFDGVIHAGRGYHWPPHGTLDFSGIKEAHKRKYNVGVVTANDDWRVARELEKAGFQVHLDPRMKILFWDGGPDGKTVLVTNRKISGAAYIDDRAVHHSYGDNWGHTLDQIDRIQAGFEPLPQADSDRRRFNPNGVAPTVPDDTAELSRPQGEVLVWFAAPASWPSGKPYKESFLPPGPTTGAPQGPQASSSRIVNAPGTQPVRNGQLRQAPAQTVAAGPPLPPGVTLPEPKDLEGLTEEVPDGADITLSNSIRKHLHTAAGKRAAGDDIGALSALRGAQTGVHAAYRAAYAENLPATMAAYGVNTLTPPAEQSSVRSEMLTGRKTTEAYRQLHHKITKHIDAFRRAHFHGQFGHMPEARFTGRETPEEMLALAEVHGYHREDRFGRIVNVTGYMREGKPYSGKLMGDEADEAIKAGVARGEFGEPTGYFQTSDGKKMWGWYGAAGLLVRHTDPETGQKRYLLQKRAQWVDNGGTYSVPGGALDVHEGGVPESPMEGAIREGREEGIHLPEGTAHAETRSTTFGEGKGAWSYHTVVMDAPHQFSPGQDVHGESHGITWVTPEEMADLPLHPHFRATAESLGMPKGGGTRLPDKPGYDPNAGMTALSRVLAAAGAIHT